MNAKDLLALEALLVQFRDDSVDREEYKKRESVRFDVAFERNLHPSKEDSNK